MRHLAVSLLLLGSVLLEKGSPAAVPAQAQASPAPEDGQTISGYVTTVREWIRQRRQAKQMRAVTEGVQASTTSTSAPEGFADRVNDTLDDFLPYFQFAVNTVSTSEDRKSVTVKFNPVSTRHGAAAFQATIVEPEIYEPLLEEIVESSRAAQQAVLESEVDDFGDVTASVTWGLHKEAAGSIWSRKRRFWGRDPKLYDQLIEDLASSLLADAFDVTRPLRNRAERVLGDLEAELADDLEELESRVDSGSGDCTSAKLESAGITAGVLEEWFAAADTGAILDRLTFGQIRILTTLGCLQRVDPDALAEATRKVGEAMAALEIALERSEPIDGITPLVDNQPQLSLSASYRNRHRLVGSDSFVATLRWEIGSRNLNSLLREYRQRYERCEDDPGCTIDHSALRREAYAEITKGDLHRAQNKFSLSLSYSWQDAHEVDWMYEQTSSDPETTLVRTANAARDSTFDISGKLQYTRLIRKGLPTQKERSSGDATPKPQLSLSAEYLLVDDADPIRRDRLIGRLSYTLPLPSGLSLPFTLTYANRSELLGEQTEQLSAHVGLSYKLNRGGS